MPAQRESLPSVTIAGVVAILFGIFTAFGSLLFALVLLLAPQMQNTPGVQPLPAPLRGVFAIFVLFFVALGIFGVFAGVGVFRRSNWARITMLIWGGIMAFFCLITVAFTLVMFSSGFAASLPNANHADSAQVMAVTRIFVVIFYGIPAAVGIWWLVLFTRPRVANAFTGAQPPLTPAMDASGFPQPAYAVSSLQPTVQPKRTSCPLPLAVIAGLTAFGSFFMLIFAVMPLPSSMPMFIFGHSFTGGSAKAIFFFWGIVAGASAIGIFLLKRWAVDVLIGLQCFGILNCAVAVLSPNYPASMRAAMQKLYGDNPALAGNSAFMTDSYFRSLMVVSALVVLAVLFVLVWQRPRFLEQASKA